MTLYNSIGKGYNSTRRADPFIASTIFNLLDVKYSGPYLEIGCGTCNYLEALTQKGLHFYGVDPSETMLEEARRKKTGAKLLNAAAENIPLENNFFYGAIAVLTLHHWKNLASGLKEIYRVLKPDSKFVAFSFSPKQMKGYWLNEYFPRMMERSSKIIPEKEEMEKLLMEAGFKDVKFTDYFIQTELCDHFLYSHKYSPEKYLEPEIRKNTSAFAAFSDSEEIVTGTHKLKHDIDTGKINAVINGYENNNGDYLFFTAVK